MIFFVKPQSLVMTRARGLLSLPYLSKTAILFPEIAIVIQGITSAPLMEIALLYLCVPLDGRTSRKEGGHRGTHG